MKQRALGDIGRCSHLKLEEVQNYAGVTLAIRCTSCTTITSHIGQCAQCGQHGKLNKFVAGKRYCDSECHTKAVRARAKTKKE